MCFLAEKAYVDVHQRWPDQLILKRLAGEQPVQQRYRPAGSLILGCSIANIMMEYLDERLPASNPFAAGYPGGPCQTPGAYVPCYSVTGVAWWTRSPIRRRLRLLLKKGAQGLRESLIRGGGRLFAEICHSA